MVTLPKGKPQVSGLQPSPSASGVLSPALRRTSAPAGRSVNALKFFAKHRGSVYGSSWAEGLTFDEVLTGCGDIWKH